MHYFEVEMHLISQLGVYYVLSQHLAKKFEQAFSMHVGQGGWEIAFCLQGFFAC